MPGSTCTIANGVDLSDYLTSGSIFSYIPQNSNTTAGTANGSNSLPHLHIDFYVNANTANNAYSYHEVDDLMFLNGARS